MKGKTKDWVALLFVVTVVYVLVRPQSNAGQFVSAVGAFGRSLVRQATGTAT